jgi:predicted aspartyl protease
MPVYIAGWLDDFRPKVRCRITPVGAPFGPSEGCEVTALVDTGATDCHIRPALQQMLGLPETERAHTSNVGVAGIKPATRITVTLVGQNQHGQVQAWGATDARAFIDEFDPTVDVILGMNVLRFLLELKIAQGVPSLIAPS